MSDQTINQLRPSLKDLNAKKLRRFIDQLDILAHQQKHLAKYYRELSLQCAQLADNMDHLDVIAFQIRHELDKIDEICD